MTFLLVYDQDRFAPLAWFVAGGRLAGAALIFTDLGAGALPGTLIVPGVADLLLGLGFLVFAISRLARRRAEVS